jgi:hypothetical protein
MAKFHLTRILPIAVVAIGAARAPARRALAARPTFHDKLNETIPDVELCGFVGTLQVTGSQVITLSDTRVKVTGEVTQILTTAAGKSVTIKNAGQFTSTFTTNGDTITFIDTYKGLPEKISARGKGGTGLRDAGVISFITTINLVTGDVTNDVIVKGPHPEADSDFTLFCTAVTAVLA